jgi:Cof subfamily protein (haloacid dehalogenase superfamily)
MKVGCWRRGGSVTNEKQTNFSLLSHSKNNEVAPKANELFWGLPPFFTTISLQNTGLFFILLVLSCFYVKCDMEAFFMKNIKLIATDMDHTLLTEAGKFPPHLDQYIDELTAKGIFFVAASGRPVATLQNMFKKHLNQMIFVGDNGAFVTYNGQTIAKYEIPKTDLLDMAEFSATQTNGHPLICDFEGAVAGRIDQQYATEFAQFYHGMRFIPDLTKWNGHANKATLYFPNKDAKEAYDCKINPRYGEHYNVTMTDTCWIDIMPKNINKGSALAQIGKHYGISADNMMAFGDMFNDVEMLRYVHHSYAVQNAHPELKKVANFATASNDDFGVTQVIKKVLRAVNH